MTTKSKAKITKPTYIGPTSGPKEEVTKEAQVRNSGLGPDHRPPPTQPRTKLRHQRHDPPSPTPGTTTHQHHRNTPPTPKPRTGEAANASGSDTRAQRTTAAASTTTTTPNADTVASPLHPNQNHSRDAQDPRQTILQPSRDHTPNPKLPINNHP